jgi:hypothetical protein
VQAPAVGPALLVTMWRLEAMSERLLAFAQREHASVAEASKAFDLRSTLDSQLLAVRVLRSSGASTGSVANLLARAADVFDEAMSLLGTDVVRRDPI